MVSLRTLVLAFVTLFCSAKSLALPAATSSVGEFLRVSADPKSGFHHDFFLYVPSAKNPKRDLLVAPNNTGSSLTELETQIQDTMRKAFSDAYIAERTGMVLLVPTFPRPNTEPPIYTHALARSALLVKDGPLQRLDLQLIAMIGVARLMLKAKEKIELNAKIFLTGFSAAASFVNRFSFLHPDLVKAAAIGSPGGWPIVPLTEYEKTTLKYPVGIGDIQDIVGTVIDLQKLRKIRFLFYIGDKDENDSVTFRDSFSDADEAFVMKYFGKKPLDRWTKVQELYAKSGLTAAFKTYPGVGHEVSRDMREDVIKFFIEISKRP